MKSITQIFLALAFVVSSSFTLAEDSINVDHSYIREVPPGVPTSALFMTLSNKADTKVALVNVTGDIAKNIELHEHVHKDGMMEMRQVDLINIPASGKTELKPGGFHVMLIGLTKNIKSGDAIELTLEFDNGSKQKINTHVKKIMQGMKMKGSMKMGKGKKINAMKKHVNPMPNLMRVYKKMGDKLNLTDEQVTKLNAGIKERSPVIKKLTASVIKLEADLLQASLNNEPVAKIEELANQLMQDRLAIIKGKTYCRESVKKVLNEQQFKKLVELYKENYI